MCNKRKLKEAIQNIDKILKEMQSYIACFTGYRPNKCAWGYNEQDYRCVNMRERTKIKIEESIKQGYHTFLCGMALGFDMICAELVLELKKQYPHIKLIGALPCKNQDALWSAEQKSRYRKLLKQLDGIRCIYDKYEDGCMIERNEYMVNNSSLVIALFDGKSGGTAKTVKYAKDAGKKVVIIEPEI